MPKPVLRRELSGPALTRFKAAGAQIDALCGVVILIALLSSFTCRYDQVVGHARALPVTCNLGFLALQMFFAITAYQLMREIAEHGEWRSYAGTRLARFLPAVTPAVLISYVLISAFEAPRLHADVTALLANLTMVADFVGAPDFDGAFWRLKIEVMFSVGLGLVCFGVGPRAAAATLVAGLAVCLLQLDGEPVRQTMLTPIGLLTMDGYLPHLVFGLALFHLAVGRNRALWGGAAALCAAMVAASNSPSHVAAVLASYWLIAAAGAGALPSLARLTLLTLLGRSFFAIYVVHQALGFVLMHGMERQGVAPEAAVLVAAAAAILCGLAIHRWGIEVARAHLARMLAAREERAAAQGRMLSNAF